ncbi:hypothetical protein WJX72_005855 [[Myrmecia] bisecta]|uniref:BBSome-interacting protein 1 n=1 Tax=[Myrmecia] bisecta TaxID=41462 RepID=A0AAW1R6T5_9CHLO
MSGEQKPDLTEILPKTGLVFSQKGELTEVLCKPKIMPLKSVTLERLEEMEAHAAARDAQQALDSASEH